MVEGSGGSMNLDRERKKVSGPSAGPQGQIANHEVNLILSLVEDKRKKKEW